MELAGAYAKAGTDVTVVEMLDEILPGYGDEESKLVRERAEDLGVEFHFGEGAEEWTDSDGGITVVTEDEEENETEHEADKVLVAVGREPVTDTMNLDAIDLDPRRRRVHRNRRPRPHRPRERVRRRRRRRRTDARP